MKIKTLFAKNRFLLLGLTFINALTFAQPGPPGPCMLLNGPNNDALLAGGSVYTIPTSAPALTSGDYLWQANGTDVNVAGLSTSAGAGSTTTIPTLTVTNFAGMAYGSATGTAGVLSVSYLSGATVVKFATFIHQGWAANMFEWHNTTLSAALAPIIAAATHPEISSGYIIFNSNPSAGHLKITGDLIIDQNFEFRDCHILLNSDAKIIINPGITLILHSTGNSAGGGYPALPFTRLNHGAKTMWDGIYLSDATSHLIVYSDVPSSKTDLLGAKNAIVSDLGGVFTISDARFANNNFDIVVNPFTGNHTGTVEGSIFDGQPGAPGLNYADYYVPWGAGFATGYPTCIAGNYLCPSSPSWLSWENPQTVSGIQITNVNQISIGNPAGAANEFRDMSYGIVSAGSNINIDNNKFYDIQPTSVFVTGNSIVANIGQNTSNYFERCGTGIYADGAIQLTIANNSFTTNNSTVNGTNINAGHLGQVVCDIYNNYFSRYNTGILGKFSSATTNAVNVHDNFFNTQSGDNGLISTTGINFAGLSSYSCDLNIFHNTDITNSCTGIALTNLRNAEINDNGIWVSPLPGCAGPGQKNGIFISSCRNTSIRNNYLFGTSPVVDPTVGFPIYGIQTYLSPNTPGSGVIRNNILEKFGAGIYAKANCDQSRFACNDFIDCHLGFRFGDGVTPATIGDQLPDGGGGYLPTGNEWFSNSLNMVGEIIPSVNWLYFGTGSYSPSPSSVLATSFAFPYLAPYLSPIDNTTSCATAGSWLLPPDHGNEDLTSEMRKRIFGGTLGNDILFSTNEDENRFWGLQQYYESFAENHSNLVLQADDDEDYQNLYSSIDNSTVGQFARFRQAVNQAEYELAESINNRIEPRSLIEENEKATNSIFLNAVKTGNSEYSDAQLLVLQSIAWSNSLLGGPGVFAARAMLGEVIPEDEFRIEARKAQTNPEPRTGSLGLTLHSTSSFYPNPTSTIANLSYSIPYTSIGDLIITNVLGNIVFRTKLSGQQNNLIVQTSSLPKGVYIYTINILGRAVSKGKLVIIH